MMRFSKIISGHVKVLPWTIRMIRTGRFIGQILVDSVFLYAVYLAFMQYYGSIRVHMESMEQFTFNTGQMLTKKGAAELNVVLAKAFYYKLVSSTAVFVIVVILLYCISRWLIWAFISEEDYRKNWKIWLMKYVPWVVSWVSVFIIIALFFDPVWIQSFVQYIFLGFVFLNLFYAMSTAKGKMVWKTMLRYLGKWKAWVPCFLLGIPLYTIITLMILSNSQPSTGNYLLMGWIIIWSAWFRLYIWGALALSE